MRKFIVMAVLGYIWKRFMAKQAGATPARFSKPKPRQY